MFPLHLWSSVDSGFCISSAYVMSGMKRSFCWLLEYSSLGGLNTKNMRKNMKFWPLNSYYMRSDWKIWLAKRFYEALTSKLWNKKIHAAEACRNGAKLNYVHPPMVLSKIFNRSIWGIAMWNSWEKIKLAIPCKENYVTWLVKNGKTVFSKLTRKISLSVSVEQASQHLTSSFPFSNFFILSAGLSHLLKFLKYPKICLCLLNTLESPKIFLKKSKSPNFLLEFSIN